MSNVIFDTFLRPYLSSKVEPHIVIVDLAVKGKGDNMQSFRSLKSNGIVVLGMGAGEGTCKNHVTIVDWQKFNLPGQEQLQPKQKMLTLLVTCCPSVSMEVYDEQHHDILEYLLELSCLVLVT